MADYREQARKKIEGWKKQLMTGAQMSELCGVHETLISKVYNRNKSVSEAACRQIIAARAKP